MKILIITLLLGLLPAKEYNRQASYKLDEAGSSIKILGTSTMHDWEMKAVKMKGTLNADFSQESIAVKNLHLTMQADELKSGKSAMDKNAYAALKTKSHPQIIYELSQLKNIKNTGTNYSAVAEGRLSVAGKTQQMSIPVTISPSGNSVKIKGQTSFKMSRFDIEPPSFMFGSVTTGDEVTIDFNLNYRQ